MQLTYLNYKEPLKEVENGYGYLGTIAQTEDGSKVQCHICGEVFYNLGAHIFNSHGLKAKEYREQFQLNRRTSLCSDKASQDYKERALKLWNSKTLEEQEAQKDVMRKAQESTNRVGRPVSLEEKNKNGMCPDQLLEKIQSLAEELDTSPTIAQFREKYGHRYIFTIQRTFGSWNQAKAQLDLSRCKSGSRIPHNKGTCKFSDEELLNYLRNHFNRTGTHATSSDWKRYYFPDYHIYLKRFGSIKNARLLASKKVKDV